VVPPPSPRLLADLARHPWYGNVRELKNELEQAVLFAPAGEPLVLERFSPDFLAGLGATPPPVPPAAALVSG
jgi:DNA-binding NtrC family response regulator